MEILTRDRAIEIASDIVEEFGDYTYSELHSLYDTVDCKYVLGGEPACIVGRILHRAGWSISELTDLDHCGGTPAGVIYDQRITDCARHFLSNLQEYQDCNYLWSEALAKAVEFA